MGKDWGCKGPDGYRVPSCSSLTTSGDGNLHRAIVPQEDDSHLIGLPIILWSGGGFRLHLNTGQIWPSQVQARLARLPVANNGAA